MLFDSHAHYDDARYDEDRDETLHRVHASGVEYILNAASDMESARASLALAQKYPFVYAAVGIHPHNASEVTEEALAEISRMTEDRKVVAYGEIGLDYYYDNSPRDVQKQWLIRQLDLASSLGLPVIIHDRDAHEDILNIIKKEKAGRFGGVFHCYTGSVEMAMELLKLNFHLSFGGPLTFKNARKAIEAVRAVPSDRLLIETDSPYLTPEPYRGKRNDSGYVHLVAEKLAEIRGISFEEAAALTSKNARDLFGIHKQI